MYKLLKEPQAMVMRRKEHRGKATEEGFTKMLVSESRFKGHVRITPQDPSGMKAGLSLGHQRIHSS